MTTAESNKARDMAVSPSESHGPRLSARPVTATIRSSYGRQFGGRNVIGDEGNPISLAEEFGAVAVDMQAACRSGWGLPAASGSGQVDVSHNGTSAGSRHGSAVVPVLATRCA